MTAWTYQGGFLPNNTIVTPTGLTSTLLIVNTMVRNRGHYTCLARHTELVNGVETVWEGEATVYVEVTRKQCPLS